ncbi:hypothetical protein FQN49_008090 [Arthroderma sp. PD_2]|nr:hypothetical protein FQN49_008090 [Arthroderma sp. PD_2]
MTDQSTRLQNRISQRKRRSIKKAIHVAASEDADETHNGTNVDTQPEEVQAPPCRSNQLLEASVEDLSCFDPHILASICPDSPPLGIMSSQFTAYDMTSQQTPPWPQGDSTTSMVSMSMLAGIENRMPHPGVMHPSCTCNGATGPCSGHLEQIRTQVLTGMATPPLMQKQQKNKHTSNTGMITPHPSQTPLDQHDFSRSK